MFGIECFVSQHQGFEGCIKSSPEDFKVTEISQKGKLASLTSSSIDLSEQLGIKPSFHAHSGEFVPKTESASYTAKSTDFVGDTNIFSSIQMTRSELELHQEISSQKDPRKCLEKVLDEQTMGEVDNFASNELKLINSQESNAEVLMISNITSTGPHQTFLNLGTISSKESRTVIHKCVRSLYPHLRTKLHKLHDNTGLEIHISREPIIEKFKELHIPLSKILDFLKFVELRDYHQTLSFEGLKSKDERTRLHHLICEHYGSFFESKTFADGASDSDGQKIVVRCRQAKKKGRKAPTSKAQIFTGFTLQKTNTETLSAIQQLAELAGVHASDFSYAGIKDKKAVTTQEMAVKRVSIQRMQDVSKELPPWLIIGNIQCRNRPVHIAELWGNHFDLSLKNVQIKTDLLKEKSRTVEDPGKQLSILIEHCIKCVKEKGFINYFGEQRFGASTLDPNKVFTNISAADVGRAILQKKYKEAVDLILSPDNGPCADPNDETNIAKRIYQLTGSSRQTLIAMPAMKTTECLLLKGLNRYGTDGDGCSKALMNIPHNMRQMYVHSFCSLIWNQMASWRMRRYGYQVVAGDLVGDEDSETKVHIVTQDDITKGTYSIMEVMLPLPGNNIQYPSHTAGAEYERRLDEAGLGNCNFRMPTLKLNVPGTYRKVIVQPRNVEWMWGEKGNDVGGEHMPTTSNRHVGPPKSSSDSLVSAGSHIPMESSGHHVTLNTNERDAVRDTAHEINAAQPQEVSSSTFESHMVSESADIESDLTLCSHDNALSIDPPQFTWGLNTVVLPTHHQTDISPSSCQSRERSSHCNKQCIESSSSQQQLCQGRILNLSFDLPTSCYATVFLRELMKL